MISILLSRVIILGLGTLYPVYSSYKAVRTKNVKEYVKWMMYWIVFAVFTSLEVFTDLFLAFWFPFYYEIKIITIIWLLSPATKGSSLIYRKFLHPYLVRKEDRIDLMMEVTRTQSYNTVTKLIQKMTDYITNLVMEGVLRAPHLMAEAVKRSSLQVGEVIEEVHMSDEEHDRFEELEDSYQHDDNVIRLIKKEVPTETETNISDGEYVDKEDDSSMSAITDKIPNEPDSNKISTRRTSRRQRQELIYPGP